MFKPGMDKDEPTFRSLIPPPLYEEQYWVPLVGSEKILLNKRKKMKKQINFENLKDNENKDNTPMKREREREGNGNIYKERKRERNKEIEKNPKTCPDRFLDWVMARVDERLDISHSVPLSLDHLVGSGHGEGSENEEGREAVEVWSDLSCVCGVPDGCDDCGITFIAL